MPYSKLNGILKEITEQYPNVDLVDFLQQNLQLPAYKAEALAARIEKEYCQKTMDKIEQNGARKIFEKPDKLEIEQKACVFSVESLSDKEFERFIEWLFEELGYEVQSEKRTTVLGVDFLAVKDGVKIVVQAVKPPKNYRVTDLIIPMSEAAKHSYECERSIVIAPAHFTEQAILKAQKSNVELWDKDTLDKKIAEAKKSLDLPVRQSCFPQFKGSLLQSLLRLDETEDFIVEPRAGGKYDLYLPSIKFPLLTFQANSDVVTRCVFRIKNNQPVSEFDGLSLIGCDHDNGRFGPDGIHAYALIIQYLKEFLQ